MLQHKIRHRQEHKKELDKDNRVKAQTSLEITGRKYRVAQKNRTILSFAKQSYSTIDNVLTNLLPAGLQDFFRMRQ